MALNINLVYTSVLQQVQKELSTGFLSADQFNSFVNQGQVELFNKYADIYQATMMVTDKILPFIKKNVLIINPTTGRMTYPTDYVDKVAVRAFEPDALAKADAVCDDDNPIDYYSLPQIKVKTIDNAELGDRLTSLVVAPTMKRPICTFYDSYLQFYPVTVGSCIFEYLRQPVEAVWAYTLDANGLPVYDSTNSVNLEWSWKMRNEIIIKVCWYFGISVRETDLIQSTNAMAEQQQ